MHFNDILDNLLEDPEFRKGYQLRDEADLALRVGSQMEEARFRAGLTQTQLARKMGTQQPSIARAERGSSLPSLSFMQKMAEALGTYLVEPKFASTYAVPVKLVVTGSETVSPEKPLATHSAGYAFSTSNSS